MGDVGVDARILVCVVALWICRGLVNSHRFREYTKALYLPYYKSKKAKWYEIMTRIFPQYDDELSAEVEILSWRRCYN